MKIHAKKTIYTIGHSTRPIHQFISLLQVRGIQKVVDIRSIPKSRFNPQFNQDVIAKSLKDAKIGYKHMGELGGLAES